MGMSGGNGMDSAVSEINVTPLIDVLLVLLIIFMVIVPMAPHGLDALLPQTSKTNVAANDSAIIVSVQNRPGASPSYLINQDPFVKADLEPKLQQIFSVRANKAMFVKGDESLNYNSIAEVINMGHQAGVDNIGIITPKVEQGD